MFSICELHDAAPFPALRELHDVLDLRAAPRVDALEVVADGHDVVVSLGEDVGELRLKPVRILVFVDENVEEVLLQHLAYPVLRLEELEAIFKKVVEVHRVSSFRAAYFSATFAISSGSTPAVFVCHLAAIISIGFDSFAASEIIFATTSFFGKSFGFLATVLIISPTSFFWSSSSRIWKPLE